MTKVLYHQLRRRIAGKKWKPGKRCPVEYNECAKDCLSFVRVALEASQRKYWEALQYEKDPLRRTILAERHEGLRLFREELR